MFLALYPDPFGLLSETGNNFHNTNPSAAFRWDQLAATLETRGVGAIQVRCSVLEWENQFFVGGIQYRQGWQGDFNNVTSYQLLLSYLNAAGTLMWHGGKFRVTWWKKKWKDVTMYNTQISFILMHTSVIQLLFQELWNYLKLYN